MEDAKVDAAVTLDEVKAELPPGLKAGPKTTEFWITVVLLVVGLVLLWKGQDAMATILIGMTGMGYNAIRTLVKLKHGAAVILIGALVFGVGCTPKGYIKADAISITEKQIRKRHDAYVKADTALHDSDGKLTPQGASDLRDTELLDGLVDEADGDGPPK